MLTQSPPHLIAAKEVHVDSLYTTIPLAKIYTSLLISKKFVIFIAEFILYLMFWYVYPLRYKYDIKVTNLAM